MRPIKSQKIIMFSKDVSSLPNYSSSKHLLPVVEENQIYPRVFPTTNIPLKVALARKIKVYQEYDLNSALNDIDWKYGKGLLDLMYFNFQTNAHLQQCTPEKLAGHIVKARAFDHKSSLFKDFTVLEVKQKNNEVYLRGFFKQEKERQRELPKFYACFLFENPQKYVATVQQASRNRQQLLRNARYNYYIDNIDLEGAPQIPKDLLYNIAKRMNIQFMNRDNFLEVNTLFKRTMNQILFNHTLASQPHLLQHSVQRLSTKKAALFKPKNRVIKLVKDNKMFKLVLKSMKTKIEQLSQKNLFFKEEIVSLMQFTKQKIVEIYKYEIFDLKDETVAVQRFTSDHIMMVGYFIHFLEQEIVGKIAAEMRKQLLAHPDGWFKVYNTDKNTYLMSKLRRFFILVQQNVKTVLKEHIRTQIKRYSKEINKRRAIQIEFNTFNDFRLKYRHSAINQIQYSPLLIVNVALINDVLILGTNHKKVEQNLVKNVNKVLAKLLKVDSPQNKALLEIFAIYKEQYGIQIELPKTIDPEQEVTPLFGAQQKEEQVYNQRLRVNNLQFQWIQTQLNQLFGILKKAVDTLIHIDKHLQQINAEMETKKIAKNVHTNHILSIKDIIAELNHYKALRTKIEDLLPGTGVDFGLFHVEYKIAKDQLIDLIEINIGIFKNLIVKEYQFFSLKLEDQLVKLMKEIEQRPKDVYELVKQREKLQNLESIISQFNEKNQLELYQLCDLNFCMLGRADQERRWLNTGKTTALFQKRIDKQKEYNQIKKEISEVITKQLQEIKDSLSLFEVTLSLIKYDWHRSHYLQNYGKLEHLKKQYDILKQQIQDVRYKETHLSLPENDFALFQTIQEDFLVLHTYWESIELWEKNKQTWYQSKLLRFQLQKPEMMLSDILANIKKIDITLKKNYSNQLYTQILEIKREIQLFQDNHLKLLKILKKDGFNKKHLQKIGIFIEGEILDLNLEWAIENGFLDKIEEIQAVSNDAWNEFYLEQTLDRVFAQLVQMKFDIIFYLDKKSNEIPLINNYQPLNQRLQTIILDLESVQFNPMKNQYQKRINDLVEKSIYISKSLQSCEIFQKKLVELHPIFDSTDVVKQLPVENKLFTKLLRNWIELLNYMKKIVSVYDSCNGQNIYEKVTYMINHIQNVKVGLANYLQRKRQGFSRFYLLTDQELYELFASTNDMKVLSKHINKLFHSVNYITFDQQSITAVEGSYNLLSLRSKVHYRQLNLQDWLTNFERSLQATIRYHIETLITMKKKWTNLLNYPCSQGVLLCYQMEKTFEVQEAQDLQKTMEGQRNMIKRLVDIKKNQKLSEAEVVTLSSLLVLALYFSDKVSFLIANNITDSEHFQMKKMMKIFFKDEQVKIRSFQTQISYGYQYLGLIRRLVLTNLTERMQLIYMSAIKYSLGGAAIGPAGTGKSETTKDIARICGKACLIYNCSQALNIEIVAKILKGMVVSGLWICFDEFNRLNYQVLNILSQQLAIIFKYKAMGMKLEVEYDREVVSFKPDFHLCITYNPTYLGRQKIPKHVMKHFRTVAMVNCDKKMICQLLLYSKGFKSAEQLSNKLNKVFEYSQRLWYSFSLYDFGLRSLISVIQLAGLLYKGEGKGQTEVIEAIRILVMPRLSQHHRELMSKAIREIFEESVSRQKKRGYQGEAENLKNILEVRVGIIMLGQIFSGKTTTMSIFQSASKEYKIQHIHINTLSVQQIYGQTNPTTRKFRDGYLTKKIREFINSPQHQRLLIMLEGVIFSEWIENLNSVLDNSRSLSLPSGQILNIPDKVKFLINCTHLQFASPATISRSCIIRFKQKQPEEILKVAAQHQRIKKRALEQYNDIAKAIKPFMLYKLDQKLIFHWVNKYLTKSKLQFRLQSFWHILSIILEGCLSDQGLKIMSELVRLNLALQFDLTQFYWDGKNWKKVVSMPNHTVAEQIQRHQHISEVVVKQQKYKKVEYLNKLFLTKSQSDELLLLLGPPNTGKSSIIRQIYQLIDRKTYVFNKINLTRKIKRDRLYSAIESGLHKKSNKRKGMLQGRELTVFLDDLNLPELNQYKYKQVVSFLTLLLQKKGCYNYNTLQFQAIQDLFLIASCNTSSSQIDFSNEFLKCCIPFFVSHYKEEQIRVIFRSIIEKNSHIAKLKPHYFSCCNSLIAVMQKLKTISAGIFPKYLDYEFVNYRNILNNVLEWDLTKLPANDQATIKQLFIYETQRLILSRLSQSKSVIQFKVIIDEAFQRKSDSVVLFHSFEKTVNGTVLDSKNCEQVMLFEQFIREVECICDQYVLSTDKPNEGLVVFPQLCVRLCYVSRGLSLKKGNISIVGLPKCGKKILLQLCNYLIRGRICRINNIYQQKNWYQTIRSASKDSLSNKCCSILLLQHFQIKETAQKEELNILLKQSYLPAAYSEADYEQLTYLLQNQLIRNRIAVNKDNTILYFVNYLKENFKIVLMFNPKMKEFKEDLINYPSILKNTEFYWITQWPTEALLMIASQAILQNELDLYISIFPKIHQTCKNITKEKTNIPHWEGLYLDYLRTFSTLYDENKQELASKINKLEKSFNIIKETELKLQSTRDQIKRLQPTILLLQKQAVKTIKSLNIQKANAEAANQQLLKKQTECSKIIAEANIVKKKLQATNILVQQELKKAWENVYLVKQSHIAEIKALMNPSELIKIVITAIIIVLNEGDIQIIKNRSEDGFSNQENYFETGKRFILSKDSKQITRLLTEYKKQKLTKQKIAMLEQKCLNHPRWNIIQAKSANRAIYYFFLWVEAVVKYFKLYQQTIPMRSQLQKSTILVDEKNKQIDIVKKQLSVYDNKIKELTRAHQEKTERLHEYSNKIKLFQKMLTRGFQILKEIESQKLKWQEYKTFIEEKQQLSFGNTILSSSLIIYNSQHIQETRELIMSQIKNILKGSNVTYNNDEIFWFLQNEEEIILKQLGIYYNHYVLNNLKIIQKTNKTVFIIDPQEQGLRFLKSMFKVKGVHVIQKIDYRNRSFKKIFEKSIIDGSIIFIEITGEEVPLAINQLISPILKKNESNGNIQIRIQDKLLPYNSKFKAYLLSTSLRDQYSIQLISKVTTVNFSITFQQLQQKLTNLFVSVQFPQESQELQELNKTNIKDNIQLKTIQKKILNIFAEMTNPQEILKTQEILQVLSTSNRLYQQIQVRIQESKEKMKHVLSRRESYRERGTKSAKLYFQIKLLKHLSPYYQYSFSWFVNLFQLNIHCFAQALAQQITKGLPQQLKVVAPLVIAESEFQKVHFYSLFNAQIEKEKRVLQQFQKLSVSQVRLAKIVGNVRNSKVQNLQLLLRDQPQKFNPMLITPFDEIMTAIPDQFSTNQFFDKLIIISCFRQDCTIKLLIDWLEINLGSTMNTPISKIIQNTRSYIPIMVQQNTEALISSVDFINNLYDLNAKQNKKSVVVINSNNNSLQRIKLMIDSAFSNDQWLVLEGLGERFQELTSFVLEFFEESDFKRKQVFRFWIILNEIELNSVSQKLIKLSMKLVFEQQTDLVKKIANAYISQQQAIIKQSDGKELNKKKYLLNELVTFHYMLNEKYKFKKKLWNQPQYFGDTDLSLNSKYLYFTQPEEMKKLYPNIVSNIIYGGKITDQQDVETISLHIDETMKNANLDRNYFWQSVWADDKFPKNQQEYEHYVRSTVIHKNSNPFKNIYEMYGITSFVNNHIAQTQYKKINEFYNAAKQNKQSKDLVSTLKNRVKQLLKTIQLKMRSKTSVSVKSEGNVFSYYFTDQKQYYSSKLELIYNQLQHFSQIQDIFSEEERNWALSIINNKIPNSWHVTTIMPLNQWISHLLDGQNLVYQQIEQSHKSYGERDQQLNIHHLHFTQNFSTFCQAIFELNSCSSKTHDLLWQPLLNPVADNLGVEVESWYLWNAIFDKAVMPLTEGMIQEYYYCTLPSGKLTVAQKGELQKITNYQPISVYNHSFQYGDDSIQILQIYMPVKKVADSGWVKRMRVHLTLSI